MAEDNQPEDGGATEKKKPKIDHKLLTKAARTMWRAENQEKIKLLASADRRAAWAQEREAYVARSRKLLRALKKVGIEVRLTGKGAAANDESDLALPVPDERRADPAAEASGPTRGV
jgi:hypothetical protein